MCMELQKTVNSQRILRKKTKAGNTMLSDFKLYYEGIKIKSVWQWHKNRHVDQWNRIYSPEISLYIYRQLIYNKGAKTIQWRKDSCSINGAWKNAQPHVQKKKKKNESRPLSYTIHKNYLTLD